MTSGCPTSFGDDDIEQSMEESYPRTLKQSEDHHAYPPPSVLDELRSGGAVSIQRGNGLFSEAWMFAAVDGERGLSTLLSDGTGPIALVRPAESWRWDRAVPVDVQLHLESLEAHGSVVPPASALEARSVLSQVRSGQLAEPWPRWLHAVACHPGGLLAHCTPVEAASSAVQIAGLPSELLLRRSDSPQPPRLKQIDLFEFHRWLTRRHPLVEAPVAARLPTAHGTFEVRLFEELWTGAQQVAMVCGGIRGPEPTLVRLHSECFTGDILGSVRCDCGPQLDGALARLAKEGSGVLLYLRQEGRGIGLFHKLRAYMTQDQGLDTVEANEQQGFPADLRTYRHAATILRKLGVTRVRLLTNNPEKIAALARHGIEVEGREELVVGLHAENLAYLKTKRDRMGHLFEDFPHLGPPTPTKLP